VVVICPKCKVRLKVDETKLAPEGKRFKCPKCGAVLIVKKPAAHARKALDKKKILVAHSNPETRGMVSSLLSQKGYRIITAADGIDAMVKALKELPCLIIAEVALPKIYGFEVCKRLKTRAETKDMKFLLVASVYDKSKYRREPVSLYGSDAYIEDHELADHVLEKVEGLTGDQEKAAAPAPPPDENPSPGKTETKTEDAPPEHPAPPAGAADEKVERARRLARTIINDIYLYNATKLDQSVRNDNFYTVFAPEIKEGQKLYDMRISQEVRDIGNFYREAIENFLDSRKKALS